MFYTDELIEEIRSRNDIVDVIGGYVTLKHKGNSYSGCCPFHNEKTPSFHVSREKQMYHCFGCGVGGNVYTFVMEYENFTFPEAIEMLAEKAGVELPKKQYSDEERQLNDYKSTLKEMNKNAAAYFHYLLSIDRGETGLKYFKEKRRLSDETINKFGLGYADLYRDDLYKYLRNKGYKDEILKDSALVKFDEARGGQDMFWNRVMFPIIDVNNRVIGFGGRVLGDGEPKYLNSKDTPVFDKSRNLYGLNLAKKSKRKGFILCEGYMDVIAMHQAGFDNAVASLGTAFTIGQANLLKRFTKEVYLAYDSDGAGVKAALRNIPILKEVGITARVIDMLPHKDPDEFIKNLGKEAFEERIDKAISSTMFQVKILSRDCNFDDPESKTRFAHEAAKLLAGIDEPLERNTYGEAVARQYMLNLDDLMNLVKKYGLAREKYEFAMDNEEEKPKVNNKETKEDKNLEPQRILLTYLVNDVKLFDKVDKYIKPNDFYEPVYHKVADMLFKQYYASGNVEPATVINMFTEIEEQRMVARIVQSTLDLEPDNESLEKTITDLVRRVKLSSIEYEMTHSNDMERWKQLISEKANVLKLHISL